MKNGKGLRVVVTGLLGACFVMVPLRVRAALRVVAPPSGVYVTVSKLTLVGTADAKVPKVTIGGARVAGPASVSVKAGGFAAPVSLKKGMNVITVRGGGTALKIKVFYLASEKDKKKVPKGFKPFYVHRYTRLETCSTCHRVKKGNYRRIVPVAANCTTGKCHGNMGKARYVHGPVGAGVCICCHNPHGSTEPKAIERTGGELCYACHQAKKKEFAREVIHPPVEDGECASCHDPHQSNLKYQLRGKSLQGLCFQCHDKGLIAHKYLHGPVGSGDCVACHLPHASHNEKLLIASLKKGALCFACHKERLEEFKRKHTHKPVGEDCGKCHDPHGSDTKAQLLMPQPGLCRKCHEKLHPKVFQAIQTAKTPHKPVQKGACTACHTPHSSNFRKQLKAELQNLCLGCHKDLGEYVKGCKYYHGPVEDGDCDACHMPHGSFYTKLLNKYFPPEFYTPYKEEKYALCFECHNKDIARDKRTTSLTNFRNGDENLHYLHVHRTKGRSCKACHDPHASVQPKHIRLEVPFGAWSYPITFTPAKNGGTCVVGCHKPKTYNRLKPVVYK